MTILNLLHFRSTNKLQRETMHSTVWSFYVIILIICSYMIVDFDDEIQGIDYQLIIFFYILNEKSFIKLFLKNF